MMSRHAALTMLNPEAMNSRNHSSFLISASQLEQSVRVAMGNRGSRSYLLNIFSVSGILPSVKTNNKQSYSQISPAAVYSFI